MTVQIDQKIFGQTKIEDTLVNRRIPIYKCLPQHDYRKISKKEKNLKNW